MERQDLSTAEFHTPGLTTSEAAAYLRDRGLRVVPSTLKTLRSKGRGPAFYRIANRCHYSPRDLDAYVTGCREEPSARERRLNLVIRRSTGGNAS